jgi:hypothetical protein
MEATGSLDFTYGPDWVAPQQFGGTGQVFDGFAEIDINFDDTFALTSAWGYREASLGEENVADSLDLTRRPEGYTFKLNYTGYFVQIGVKTILF